MGAVRILLGIVSRRGQFVTAKDEQRFDRLIALVLPPVGDFCMEEEGITGFHEECVGADDVEQAALHAGATV